jgi:hypothetical protein
MTMSIEKSNGPIENLTRDLPACSIVAQPNVLPSAPTSTTDVDKKTFHKQQRLQATKNDSFEYVTEQNASLGSEFMYVGIMIKS